MVEEIIRALAALPPLLIYAVIGAGAAVENFVPPIPADTFVLFGAFLAAAGRADPLLVFLVTWVANVASALGVYALAWRYGDAFFRTPVGRHLLHPHQIRQIARFYERWGTPAILASRFLPAFRAVVPVFAGVSRIPLRRVAPPLALASAVWYGVLVYIGAAAGRNWEWVRAIFSEISGVLLWIAVPLLAAIALWWWNSRRPGD